MASTPVDDDDGSPYARYNEHRRTPPPKVMVVKCGSCQQIHYMKGVTRIGEARNVLIEMDWLVIQDESHTLDDLWLCPSCAPIVKKELNGLADELERRPPLSEDEDAP